MITITVLFCATSSSFRLEQILDEDIALFIFFNQKISPVGRYVSQARAEWTKLSRVYLEYYLLSRGHCYTTQVIYEKVSCQTALWKPGVMCIVFSDKVIVLNIALCLSLSRRRFTRLPASMQM